MPPVYLTKYSSIPQTECVSLDGLLTVTCLEADKCLAGTGVVQPFSLLRVVHMPVQRVAASRRMSKDATQDRIRDARSCRDMRFRPTASIA